MIAQDVCQGGKHRLCGKCQALPALLKSMLDSEDLWVAESCQLGYPLLQDLSNILLVLLGVFVEKFLLQNENGCLLSGRFLHTLG